MYKKPLFNLSPLSILTISYFLQALEFILVLFTLRYILYEPSKGIISTSAEGGRLLLVDLALGAYFLGQFLFSSHLGRFSDRYGRRKTLISIQIFWVLGYLFCAMASAWFSLVLFILGRIAIGGASSIETIGLASLCDLYEEGANRLKAFGLFFVNQGLLSAVFFGLTISLPTPSLDPISSPIFLFLLAAATAFISLFLIISLPETNPEAARSVQTLRIPQLKPLLGFTFFAVLATATSSQAAVKEILSRTEDAYFFALALFFAVWAAASSWILPLLSKKVSIRKILYFSWGLLGILFLFYGSLGIFHLICSALAMGLTWPLLLWMIGTISPPEEYGTALGMAQALSGLAFLLGPFLLDQVLPYPSFILAFVLFGIAVAFFFFGKHLRPEIDGRIKLDNN